MGRIFSEAEEQAAVKRYLEDPNLTVTQLAVELQRDRNTLARVLRRNGVKIRHVKTLTSEEKTEIIKKYFDEKISLSELGRQYQVNKTSILKLLRKHGRNSKKTTEFKTRFAEEIVKKYLDNDITHAELAKEYGCERATITHIIAEAEVSDPKYQKKRKPFYRRKISEKRFLPITPEQLIAEKEATRMSYSKLADKYHVSESCIGHAIRRHRKTVK